MVVALALLAAVLAPASLAGPAEAQEDEPILVRQSVRRTVPLVDVAAASSGSTSIELDAPLAAVVAQVKVGLVVTGTSDVDVSLEHAGRTVRLANATPGPSVGLGEGCNGRVTFDEFATDSVGDAASPVSGTYRPIANLSDYVGTAAAGEWVLHVSTSGSAQPARIDCFVLTVEMVLPQSGLVHRPTTTDDVAVAWRDGRLTLREAVRLADAIAAPAAIALGEGTYGLDCSMGTIRIQFALDISIRGDGSTINPRGCEETVLRNLGDGHLRLDGVSFVDASTAVDTDGPLEMVGGSITGAANALVLRNGGELRDVTISDADAQVGSIVSHRGGTLSIEDSRFLRNFAGGSAIDSSRGALRVDRTAFVDHLTGDGVVDVGRDVEFAQIATSTFEKSRGFATNGSAITARGATVVTMTTFVENASPVIEATGLRLFSSVFARTTETRSCPLAGGWQVANTVADETTCPTDREGLTVADPQLVRIEPGVWEPGPSSPLLDRLECERPDQRGVERPQGDLCDIGAIERIVRPDAPTPGDDDRPQPGDQPDDDERPDAGDQPDDDHRPDAGDEPGGADRPAPDDAVTCNGLVATIVGTEGDDVLTGTAGPDVIAALGGDDVVRGLGGDDVICGGPGKDHLSGGRGRDMLFGQSGRDVVKGGKGRDELVGGRGRDRLFGQSARDRLSGGPGRDLLDGGSAKDTCTGGKGRDTLRRC